MIYSLGDRRVQLPTRYYVADTAAVIGSVILHDDASVWFNAVVRADNDVIEIGAGSNVQDGAILHTDPGYRLQLGRGVTAGHKVMLHGCRVGDNSLIGINSVVLNGAEIGHDSLVGANSLITENKSFPPGSLILGAPARVARALRADEIAALRQAAEYYVEKIAMYRSGLTLQSG